MEGSVSSSASQPPGQSPWKIAAKPNNTTRKQPAKVAYSITQALPGKVAFCIPRISDDPQYLQRLQALIKSQQWMITQQVNPEAGSVVITYKMGMMSDFEMRSELASLLQTADNAQVEEQESREAEEQESQCVAEVPSVVATSVSRGAGEEYTTQNSALSNASPLKSAEPPTHSAVAYSIVHAIPGRIRFHIPQIACDRQYVQRLENLLKADPVVTSERINRDAASVVITYKTGILRESEARTHNIVEAEITHLKSLIQSANEATAEIAANATSRI